MQKKIKIIIALAFLIFCVSFSFRIYFLESKQIAHMDEILSIVLFVDDFFSLLTYLVGYLSYFALTPLYNAAHLEASVLTTKKQRIPQ